MKNYIRHSDSHVKIHNTFIKGNTEYATGLPTSVTYIKDQLDKMAAIANAGEPKKALIHFGNALHVLEDFFAHTNFVELALMKVKGDWVFPWVDVQSPELTNYEGSGNRFKVKNEREMYKNFKRDKDAGEINFFDRDGTIKTLTDKEFQTILSKVKNQGNLGRDEYFTHVKVVNGVMDSYGTFGLPLPGEQYCKLYYVYEGMRYKIEGVTHRREMIASSFFWLFTTHSPRDITAKLSFVPDSMYRDEIILKSYLNDHKATYEHIPIVTGLFRGEDAMYSITDKVLSMVELDSFEWMDLANNDGYSVTGVKYSKYLVTVADYCIMLILNDLSDKQNSETDRVSAHLGAVSSEYLKNYQKFIDFRRVVFSVIELAPKSMKYFLTLLTNAFEKMAMNLIKGTLRAMIISNMKEFKGSQGQTNKLGTNPTHTQIAKDSSTHPFHGLAAQLAQIAVQDIGRHVHDYVFDGKGDIEDIKKKAEEFFSHPKDVDWMDLTVYIWLSNEMNKKPGYITRFNHWAARGWNINEEDLERLIQKDHDTFGVKYERNEYGHYQKISEEYQQQMENGGGVNSQGHDHGGNHDIVEGIENQSKEDADFFEEIRRKMNVQEAVFIEDMNFSAEWIEAMIAKMQRALADSNKEVENILSVYEKSIDIDAFAEDLKTRGLKNIEETKKYLKDAIKSLENNMEFRVNEKFKD